MICRRSQFHRAFTLVELLAVITIIVIIAAIVGPSLSHFRKGDAMIAATRQMLDDVAAARQLAISQRTDVYMIFVSSNFWGNLPRTQALTNLLDKQLTGYAFVSLRSAGDQPGQGVPRYLSHWRRLPESIYIAPQKFDFNGSFTIVDTNAAATYQIRPFKSSAVPFPLDSDLNSGNWPCIGFNYLGQLISGQDELIPLAHGSVSYARDPSSKALWTDTVSVDERPVNNSRDSYNIIHIDWLTGRARLERKENR
jgi:prepilin-type N-terminal cleavage/methylation domain-containing protein